MPFRAVLDRRQYLQSVAQINAATRGAQGVLTGFIGVGTSGLSGLALAGVGAGLAIVGIGTAAARASDEITRIEARLGLVTGNIDGLSRSVFDIAQRTRQEFEVTANLTSRIAQSTDLSLDQVLQITEAVNQAVAISGSAGQESAGAIRQLTQAFSSQIVRAEEFNSILEGAPELSRALARELGVSVGEFGNMVRSGRVLSTQLGQLILGQVDELAETFAEMPRTIAEANTQLGNSTTLLLNSIGEAINLRGILSSIADGLRAAADDISGASDLRVVDSEGLAVSNELLTSYREELVRIEADTNGILLRQNARYQAVRDRIAEINDLQRVYFLGLQDVDTLQAARDALEPERQRLEERGWFRRTAAEQASLNAHEAVITALDQAIVRSTALAEAAEREAAARADQSALITAANNQLESIIRNADTRVILERQIAEAQETGEFAGRELSKAARTALDTFRDQLSAVRSITTELRSQRNIVGTSISSIAPSFSFIGDYITQFDELNERYSDLARGLGPRGDSPLETFFVDRTWFTEGFEGTDAEAQVDQFIAEMDVVTRNLHARMRDFASSLYFNFSDLSQAALLEGVTGGADFFDRQLAALNLEFERRFDSLNELRDELEAGLDPALLNAVRDRPLDGFLPEEWDVQVDNYEQFVQFFLDATDRARGETQEIFERLARNIRENQRELLEDLQNDYRSTFTSLADSVGSMFTRFEDSFEGWVDLLLSQVPRVLELFNQLLIARQAVAFSGGTPSLFSGLFSGGSRASGGRVLAGRAYLVGENGPEPFVPAVNGTIYPNSQDSGGDINVYLPVVNLNGDIVAQIESMLPQIALSAEQYRERRRFG